MFGIDTADPELSFGPAPHLRKTIKYFSGVFFFMAELFILHLVFKMPRTVILTNALTVIVL